MVQKSYQWLSLKGTIPRVPPFSPMIAYVAGGFNDFLVFTPIFDEIIPIPWVGSTTN